MKIGEPCSSTFDFRIQFTPLATRTSIPNPSAISSRMGSTKGVFSLLDQLFFRWICEKGASILLPLLQKERESRSLPSQVKSIQSPFAMKSEIIRGGAGILSLPISHTSTQARSSYQWSQRIERLLYFWTTSRSNESKRISKSSDFPAAHLFR